jgi:hypothetical protein
VVSEDSVNESSNPNNRISSRRKKIPLTRGKDFFMGVSASRATNDKLVRPPQVDGNLPCKGTSYWNNKHPEIHENFSYDNNNSNNTKDIIFNPSCKLTIFHQNIRVLGKKIGEFETHVLPRLPQIVCITEHQLCNQEIGNISINQYLLGAYYCRSSRKFGGVNIFVHESLTYLNIDVNRYCHVYDLEACALKIKIRSDVYCIVCIYRSPTGELSNFLTLLDSMLAHLHSSSVNLIICGDININYLQTSSSKNQLESLMALYNLYGVVEFPTRITESSSTAIDNVFINKGKILSIQLAPFITVFQITMRNYLYYMMCLLTINSLILP